MSQARTSRLRHLKWLAVLAPISFLGILEAGRRLIAPDLWQTWPGYLLLGAIVLLATLVFTETVFGVIGRMQGHLAQQNQELLALHEAGLAITGELDLEVVLQTVVNEARDLAGARYGALTLLDEAGGIETFLTSGMDPAEVARLGAAPTHHGLLRAVIDDGRPLRIADVSRDPRAIGFPPHHPPMQSLLAVPIISRERVLGSLYVAENVSTPAFDADDQQRLERFATQATIAIESARLHRRIQVLAVTEERERIAREMHDSLAQVLGYVNTKAQAAQSLLEVDQPERAAAQIGQLAQAARDAYADVRENILGLRTSLDHQRTLVEASRSREMVRSVGGGDTEGDGSYPEGGMQSHSGRETIAMQAEITCTVSLPDTVADINEVEQQIVAWGQEQMRQVFAQAWQQWQCAAAHCPQCGSTQTVRDGTKSYHLRTLVGTVTLPRQRRTCRGCGRHFQPLDEQLHGAGPGRMTGTVAELTTLVAASWPFATAAWVLGQLLQERISPEWLRYVAEGQGEEQAQVAQAAADQLLAGQAELPPAPDPRPTQGVRWRSTGASSSSATAAIWKGRWRSWQPAGNR